MARLWRQSPSVAAIRELLLASFSLDSITLSLICLPWLRYSGLETQKLKLQFFYDLLIRQSRVRSNGSSTRSVFLFVNLEAGAATTCRLAGAAAAGAHR